MKTLARETVEAGVYIASRTKHAHHWRMLRAIGVPFISTWIDEADEGQTSDWADLWERCISEASTASALILYAEPEDVLSGALIEAGAALAHGKRVYVVGESPSIRKFVRHPLVQRAESVHAALTNWHQWKGSGGEGKHGQE